MDSNIFNTLKSSFKVPTSAMPNKVDQESVLKTESGFLNGSCQEVPNPASSGHCSFSSGGVFSSTKEKQTEVGEAMQSSRKQNNNMKH